MFQSTLLKRAARYATPAAAAAAAATTVGVASSTMSMTSEDDTNIIMKSRSTTSALCDDKKEEESVLSMLGDIQSRVSFFFLSCIVFVVDVGSIVFCVCWFILMVDLWMHVK